ncbi:MAG: PHP domain-containing protein, partial [Anaerolineales bacterium]
MGLADLHIHSIYSVDGAITISAILNYVASRTNLNVIAITDHDEIAGALQAEKMAHHY